MVKMEAILPLKEPELPAAVRLLSLRLQVHAHQAVLPILEARVAKACLTVHHVLLAEHRQLVPAVAHHGLAALEIAEVLQDLNLSALLQEAVLLAHQDSRAVALVQAVDSALQAEAAADLLAVVQKVEINTCYD